MASRQEFVRQTCQCINVIGRLGLLPSHQLRTGIAWRDRRRRLRLRRFSAFETRLGPSDPARHIEIDDLDLAPIQDDDIPGFQVAVHDAIAVGVIQCIRNGQDYVLRLVAAQSRGRLSGRRAAVKFRIQRRTGEVFHGDEHDRVISIAIENTYDIRMRETPELLNFLSKGLERSVVFIDGAGEHLHRDEGIR